MTKKDYEIVAAVIARRIALAPEECDPETSLDVLIEIKEIATDLADKFQADNPRFDRSVFMAACGIERSES